MSVSRPKGRLSHPSLSEQSVSVLRGVGPMRVRLLERLGVRSVEDLLLLSPRRIDVYLPCEDLAHLTELIGQLVRLRGSLGAPNRHWGRGRRSLTKARLHLKEGTCEALWFNQPWAHKRVKELWELGQPVELLGRVVRTKTGLALASPRLREITCASRFEPERESVYPTTAGLGQELLRSLMQRALERFAHELEEPLSRELRESLGLASLGEALHQLHGSDSSAAIDTAHRRLALEQALCLQAKLLGKREAQQPYSTRGSTGGGLALKFSKRARAHLLANLPHDPTSAQRRVLGEIFDDLARPTPMRRLLQGDVGSGKTLVAAGAALLVAQAGKQAALLAPTTLLAEQHALEIGPMFERAGRRVVLLTAGLPGPRRKHAEAHVRNGTADLVVGTHALLSERVAFKNLGLAIIDEQQRFGVAAKEELIRKGANVHALLVTATPIPRTLALALYGELDVSVLDEFPPGRKGVSTSVLEPDQRGQALALLRQRLVAGERAFWVCPRIFEGDSADGKALDDASAAEDVASVERAFGGLSKGSLGQHGVVLVHGDLPAEVRAERLAAFRHGQARLLVGTSVVEVGLDVPEATVIVVESAQRMGLAQLHQLRGRVGRGVLPGYCVLLVAPGMGSRLELLEQTNDGFRIAEEDLARRGAGDLIGSAQAGGTEFWDSAWGGDLELLLEAQKLLTQNPALLSIYRTRGGNATGIALV